MKSWRQIIIMMARNEDGPVCSNIKTTRWEKNITNRTCKENEQAEYNTKYKAEKSHYPKLMC
jgi:hypothetical protein